LDQEVLEDNVSEDNVPEDNVPEDNLPDDTCMCSTCAPWYDDPGFGEMSMADDDYTIKKSDGYACMDIYPSYAYVPDLDATVEVQGVQRATHDYLVKMNKLPRPLPENMLAKHEDVLKSCYSAASTRAVHKNFVTKGQVINNIKAIGSVYDTLLMSLCGHGCDSIPGSLMLSDGTALTLKDIARSLVRANFKGRLVLIVNTCHAGSNDAETVVMENPFPNSAFKWIVVNSCDANESQKPSHAAHVVRMGARLLKDILCVHPTWDDYERIPELVERYWNETRGTEHIMRPWLWRAPPTVLMN
jgi:hypothetical protein